MGVQCAKPAATSESNQPPAASSSGLAAEDRKSLFSSIQEKEKEY